MKTPKYDPITHIEYDLASYGKWYSITRTKYQIDFASIRGIVFEVDKNRKCVKLIKGKNPLLLTNI